MMTSHSPVLGAAERVSHIFTVVKVFSKYKFRLRTHEKKKQTKNLSNDFDYFNLTQSNAWMVDHARITPVQGAYSGQRVCIEF